MKTEYRIIPCRTYIADLYLQFKRTRTVKKFFGGTKEVTEWCFIPEYELPKWQGMYLTIDECPTQLPYGKEHRFISCFDEQESYDVIPFTKEHPDIQEYFDKLQDKRKNYLEEEKRKDENRKTIYL